MSFGWVRSNIDLLKLAGYAEYFYDWRLKHVMLWSANMPPRSLMELWLYVAHALRELAELRINELKEKRTLTGQARHFRTAAGW